MVELKRLCRTEPKLPVSLTEFLSKCHKKLKSKGIKYVVSFSDPAHNHNGGVYKVANFTHLGKTQAERHVIDTNGNDVHRRLPYRYAKRNGCTIGDARAHLGLSIKKTIPKDRWFIKL